MSTEKITADDFARTVQDALDQYGDACMEVVEKTIKEVAKEASRELKSSGTGTFKDRTGKYRKSWTVATEKKNISFKAIVNARSPHYRLTHLLEYGHALRRGGRTIGEVKAYPHIAGVNDWAQERAVRKLGENLEKL